MTLPGRKTNNPRAHVHWKTMQEAPVDKPWIEPRYWGNGIRMVEPSHLRAAEDRAIFDNWAKRQANGFQLLSFGATHIMDVRLHMKEKLMVKKKNVGWVEVGEGEDITGSDLDCDMTDRKDSDEDQGPSKGKGKANKGEGVSRKTTGRSLRKGRGKWHQQIKGKCYFNDKMAL